jgi:hypothetical protein
MPPTGPLFVTEGERGNWEEVLLKGESNKCQAPGAKCIGTWEAGVLDTKGQSLGVCYS